MTCPTCGAAAREQWIRRPAGYAVAASEWTKETERAIDEASVIGGKCFNGHEWEMPLLERVPVQPFPPAPIGWASIGTAEGMAYLNPDAAKHNDCCV